MLVDTSMSKKRWRFYRLTFSKNVIFGGWTFVTFLKITFIYFLCHYFIPFFQLENSCKSMLKSLILLINLLIYLFIWAMFQI